MKVIIEPRARRCNGARIEGKPAKKKRESLFRQATYEHELLTENQQNQITEPHETCGVDEKKYHEILIN